jgi:hypothetical protein
MVALRRRAGEHRIAERRDLGRAAQELEVVLDGLAEPEAGSMTMRSRAMPAASHACARAEQEIADFAHDVVVRGGCCIVRGSPCMCMRQMATSCGNAPRARTASMSARTSLTHRGAGVDRGAHDGRLHRVDADDRAFAGEGFDDRQHALELVGLRDAVAARARRFAAIVDDVAPSATSCARAIERRAKDRSKRPPRRKSQA